MPIEVAILQESGEIFLVEIPAGVVQAAQLLPFELDRYFLIDDNATMIPVTALLQTRARPTGIEHAVNLMKLAYEGKQERREPLSVRARADGRYLVVDGNSTATVARAAGWRSIPAILLPQE